MGFSNILKWIKSGQFITDTHLVFDKILEKVTAEQLSLVWPIWTIVSVIAIKVSVYSGPKIRFTKLFFGFEFSQFRDFIAWLTAVVVRTCILLSFFVLCWLSWYANRN